MSATQMAGKRKARKYQGHGESSRESCRGSLPVRSRPVRAACSSSSGTRRSAERMWENYKNVENILYVNIAVIGVPVNVVAIAILSQGKCGLSNCTTRYLVAMAAADLLVIITEVILFRINYHYFPRSFLSITYVCRVMLALVPSATNCSVWFTVNFTFDRFVAICCQRLKTKYCSGKTAAVVLSVTGVLLCLKNVPFYFAYKPAVIINNVPWFCRTIDIVYTDPRWVGFDWFDTILTPLLPFAVILLLNTLTVRHILVSSRVRKELRGRRNGEKHSDPELESRKRSVVLLFTLSGSFILLWLTTVAEFIYYQITGTAANRSDSEMIFHRVGYLLSNASCCTNTFIYAVTQSKFREEVKRAVKYPVTSVFRIIKKYWL
ncbi:probable G-protein coupled receptor 139 [Leucoraja erinacea]|uniref:probable G-protein coupled receptor 139 n=1 Tax=Leucoraja erinaceus TaxID=7782 RepID=UPI002453833E|nr:probable G-protein coupled receptor 139 [Leucoraja erinacea]